MEETNLNVITALCDCRYEVIILHLGFACVFSVALSREKDRVHISLDEPAKTGDMCYCPLAITSSKDRHYMPCFPICRSQLTVHLLLFPHTDPEK